MLFFIDLLFNYYYGYSYLIDVITKRWYWYIKQTEYKTYR